MAQIEFLGPLSHKKKMEVDIKSLSELKSILEKDTEINKWLDICSIAINDELILDKNRAVKEDDKIVFLPPVCGG